MTDPGVELRLRDLGFGYRARFLQQSSQIIVNSHVPDWLQSLRSAPYLQARDALKALPGVGLKVIIYSTFMHKNTLCKYMNGTSKLAIATQVAFSTLLQGVRQHKLSSSVEDFLFQHTLQCNPTPLCLYTCIDYAFGICHFTAYFPSHEIFYFCLF